MERRLLSRHMVGFKTSGRQSDQLDGTFYKGHWVSQVRHVLWYGVKEGLITRATFTIHDQPTMLLDYKRQQELLTAAKDHTGE
jgi:hypothetical protein